MEYTTNLPETNSLLCIYAKHIDDTSYNNTIIQCRKLLFENQDIIAYPKLKETEDPIGRWIVIVVQKVYHQEKLEQILQKYKLEMLTEFSHEVSTDTYKRCCEYTLSAKIAPQWNTIADYFVKGRDFLTDSSPLDCTKLTISITESGEARFIFNNTGRVKLPKMSEESSFKDLTCRHNLHTEEFTEVVEHEHVPVRVLPRLTKGTITAIKEARDGERSDESERRWEDTYGIIVPREELYFLKIHFNDEFPDHDYPLICVWPKNPFPDDLEEINSDEIIKEFITYMKKAIPILLGESFELLSGNEIDEDTNTNIKTSINNESATSN